MTAITSKLTQAKTLSVSKAEIPSDIPEGYVLIKIDVAGICGTDMHYFNHFENAGFKLNRALTLGHEACGQIQDPNGSSFKMGQLVALNPIIACGGCSYCLAGKENFCLQKKFPGSALTLPHIDGFFQSHIVFPAKCCIPVKETTKAKHLAFAEPLGCSLHSVNQANINASDNVLVTGCGPMGLLAIVAALSKGATVTCLDLKPESVALGVKLGAKNGLIIDQFESSDYLDKFDAIIEASGSIHAFNFALESVKKGGQFQFYLICRHPIHQLT
ncbi:alcohol dehydrogenase catalytic domain-containing protein [Marinomonas sp. 15G1-11]|uniref:Alcohol dehydrogenase catalytic domain-containing protein n=1 Tax=Marinomonas phaeophyticola TaxID=3004091 RepID=A0ABT4JXD9_9GAMM|nr:alcohol dehydrogenase catalytic domain-containing protein [Marinomonas sp. 15G1-11]MCZ2722953.1 alcohol dehydrogenase catalytic domain-containing protein [Marinomonas sp. 15G1-11]